jgi:uncharacterized membrane protein YjgN (DUF898 family)
MKFTGCPKELLKLSFKNIFLIVVTMSIYTPWAIQNWRRFFWDNIHIGDKKFSWEGTGKEIFLGFLLGLMLLFLISGTDYWALLLLQHTGYNPAIIFKILSAVLSLIFFPIVFHKAIKYRISRIKFDGQSLYYDGNISELTVFFIRGMILTFVTLGLYYFNFKNNLRSIILNGICYGDQKVAFSGKGKDIAKLSYKGIFLSIITLGVYYFWYEAQFSNFTLNNTSLGDASINAKIDGPFILKAYTKIFLSVLTLGILTPWALVSFYRGFFERVSINGSVEYQTPTSVQPSSTKESLFDISSSMLSLDSFFTFGF